MNEEEKRFYKELIHQKAILEESPVDTVNHPSHYNQHPAGIECIDVVEEMGFNLGNAVKYIWRAFLKGNPIEDLKKARWYIDREIQRSERRQGRDDKR